MMKRVIVALLVLGLCGCHSGVIDCRNIDYYDYMNSVPSNSGVEDSYWNDALIVGDSRVGSLALYSDVKEKGADVYYAESVSLWTLKSMVVSEYDGKSTLYDILKATNKHNIYIMLGLNEIGNNNFDEWEVEFNNLIGELNKDGVNIYLLLSYMPQSLNGYSDEEINTLVTNLNDHIKNVASSNRIFFISMDKNMYNGNGQLDSEYTWDGLHFNVDGAKAYVNYLLEHTVKEEGYVKKVCA